MEPFAVNTFYFVNLKKKECDGVGDCQGPSENLKASFPASSPQSEIFSLEPSLFLLAADGSWCKVDT